MGMYSGFIEQRIKVKNKKAVKEYKKMVEEEDRFYDKKVLYPLDDNGNVDFSEWDDMKLEGYWFEDTKLFLNEIAWYIEGYAVFDYAGEYYFRLIFKDDKVCIQKEKREDDKKLFTEEFWKNFKIEELREV